MSREDIKHHGKLEREYEWENVVEGINHATETGHQVVILLEYD